jgi:hypothetical protein
MKIPLNILVLALTRILLSRFLRRFEPNRLVYDILLRERNEAIDLGGIGP